MSHAISVSKKQARDCADKLSLLADWFDMKDRESANLDDEVQTTLRKIAALFSHKQKKQVSFKQPQAYWDSIENGESLHSYLRKNKSGVVK